MNLRRCLSVDEMFPTSRRASEKFFHPKMHHATGKPNISLNHQKLNKCFAQNPPTITEIHGMNKDIVKKNLVKKANISLPTA